MKKILLVTAIALGFGINANASTQENTNTVISVEQDKQYTPIDASTIPAEALKKIGSKYGGYTLKEAHAAADGEYKLILSKDDKTVTAFFSSTGEFLKEA